MGLGLLYKSLVQCRSGSKTTCAATKPFTSRWRLLLNRKLFKFKSVEFPVIPCLHDVEWLCRYLPNVMLVSASVAAWSTCSRIIVNCCKLQHWTNQRNTKLEIEEMNACKGSFGISMKRAAETWLSSIFVQHIFSLSTRIHAASASALHLELVNMDKVDFVQKTQMIVDSGLESQTNPRIPSFQSLRPRIL